MIVLTLYANNPPHSLFPQLISEPVLPLSSLLSASLLSEHVERERDERGREKFRVRALFHKRGDTSPRSTCITLHAFKETEEHKASCMTQVRTRLFSLPLSHSFIHLAICFPASSWAVCGDPDVAKRLVRGSTRPPPVSAGLRQVAQAPPPSAPGAEAGMAAGQTSSQLLLQPSACNVFFAEVTFVVCFSRSHLF